MDETGNSAAQVIPQSIAIEAERRPAVGAEAGERRPRRYLWLLAIALGLATLVGYRSGVFWYVADASRLRDLVLTMGPAGPIIFILMFSVLEAFGVPGLVFVGAAALVWPLWVAVLLSWTGGVAAALLAFFFARSIGREWVQRRMPARFRQYDERLSGGGTVSVVIARLLFFMAPPAHWMLGLSSVGWPAYLVGTIIGLLPGIILVSVGGKGLVGFLATQPPKVWIIVALIVGATILAARRLRAGTDSLRASANPLVSADEP